jgi:hypothetical protein
MQHYFNGEMKTLHPAAIVMFLEMGDKFTLPKFTTVVKTDERERRMFKSQQQLL